MVSFLENFEAYKKMDFSYQFVIGLVTILLFFSVIFFFYIVISRIFKNYIERNLAKYLAEYEELLTELIFDEDKLPGTDYFEGLRVNIMPPIYKSHLRGKAFVTVLIELMKAFSGPTALVVRSIYFELELDKYAAKQLRSHFWNRKIRGLRELRIFKAEDWLGEVIGLTNHPNKLVRDEAQIAVVEIGETQALSFILDVSKPITQWQQLRLLERLKNIHRDKIPEFSAFLTSKNPSVLVFTLKLISYFNQVSATEKVAELLQHSNPEVQKEAIKVLVKNFSFDYFEEITNNFNRREKSVKLEIIKAISVMGDEQNYDLLLSNFRQGDFDLSMASARTLAEMGAIDLLNEKLSVYGSTVKEIIKHAINERV